MKRKRLDRILEIINEYDIETQDALLEKLRAVGYDVTQATVSRDIRELGLVKVSSGVGTMKYSSPDSKHKASGDRYNDLLGQTLHSADSARNIAVLKTHSGMAQAAAAAIDAMDHPKLVGCIAGDDTIFAAFKSDEDAAEFVAMIEATLLSRRN